MRANAFVEQGDGYSDNLTTGDKVNDRNGYGGRVAFRWVPSDTFEGVLSVDYYNSDQNGLYAADIAGIIAPPTKDLFTLHSGIDTSNIGRTSGASLTLNFDLSETVQLQSITGFRNVYREWNLDLTDQPIPVYTLFTVNDTDSYSQELKLNGRSSDSRFTYTAGLFAYKETNFSFIGDEINLWFPGDTRVPLPFFGRNYDMDVTSYAAFAEGQYAITDKLSLIAGGRYTKDDKDLVIDARVGGTPGTSMVGGVRQKLQQRDAQCAGYTNQPRFRQVHAEGGPAVSLQRQRQRLFHVLAGLEERWLVRAHERTERVRRVYPGNDQQLRTGGQDDGR